MTAFTLTIFSQQIDSLGITSNSFDNNYHKSNPTLVYSYDAIAKIHDYSNNWDFDKDGIKDELYFIGTGGAHLYYFFKVVLSSDKKSREFNFIQSDFPFLTSTDTLNIEKKLSGFVVANLGKDLTPTIIVRLDNSTYYANKKEFTKKKIKTRNVSISFENRKIKYGSL